MDPSSGAAFSSLDTPCLLLDEARLDANIARMEARCRTLGVAFRPHLKTAKSPAIAERIPSARTHGIAVSTLREAEDFAAAGYDDILYAVCLAPRKVDRSLALCERGTRLRLAVDHLDAVAALASGAAARKLRPAVLIEVDCGEHRCGVLPQSPDLLALGRAIADHPNLQLDGVFTHGGHSYGARSVDGIADVAEAERDAVARAAAALEGAGLPCPVRSVGSTPTLTHARDLSGVTEARAGVFVFQDAHQVGLGSCALDDVALTVLTTVIAVHEDHAILDAGGLALSKDRSTASLGEAGDIGYGTVLDADAKPLPGMRVRTVFQEHGVVAGPGYGPGILRVGQLLRIAPNHACMTAAAYDQYHRVRSGVLEGTWSRTNGW